MESDIKRRSRAPRYRWEFGLVWIAILLPTTLYPFLSGNTVITPFVGTMAVIVLAAGFISLSLVFDITPTFITKAEADFQNEMAGEMYSIPVVFRAVPTAFPGFSRLRATRADRKEPISVWTLRFHHGRRSDES